MLLHDLFLNYWIEEFRVNLSFIFSHEIGTAVFIFFIISYNKCVLYVISFWTCRRY